MIDLRAEKNKVEYLLKQGKYFEMLGLGQSKMSFVLLMYLLILMWRATV